MAGSFDLMLRTLVLTTETDRAVDDAELVRQACLGDRDAYAVLVRRWSARVLAVCHSRVRRRDVAQELAQESLLRGFESLDRLDSPDRFGPWLRGIAQHVCLDWLKKKQTSQVVFSELPVDQQPRRFLESEPDHSAERADDLRQLMNEVELLPEELREVLMLYYCHDTTYQELAELLGVSSATINARLTKARSLLKERMARTRRNSHEV